MTTAAAASHPRISAADADGASVRCAGGLTCTLHAARAQLLLLGVLSQCAAERRSQQMPHSLPLMSRSELI